MARGQDLTLRPLVVGLKAVIAMHTAACDCDVARRTAFAPLGPLAPPTPNDEGLMLVPFSGTAR